MESCNKIANDLPADLTNDKHVCIKVVEVILAHEQVSGIRKRSKPKEGWFWPGTMFVWDHLDVDQLTQPGVLDLISEQIKRHVGIKAKEVAH
jgi:hypothetical protein